ncbi:unnamed protein product [Ectocarpus sp. 12 AP-2014]
MCAGWTSTRSPSPGNLRGESCFDLRRGPQGAHCRQRLRRARRRLPQAVLRAEHDGGPRLQGGHPELHRRGAQAPAWQQVRWLSRDYIESPTGLYLTSVKVDDLDLLDYAVQAVHQRNKLQHEDHDVVLQVPSAGGVVIHQMVLSPTQISITKIFNDDNPYVWADKPGPLKIVAINTGGGSLALNPADGGVVIAEVHADFDYGPLAMRYHKSLGSFQIY